MTPTTNANPFLKWAGGKNQLLNQIRSYYPFKKYPHITKYAEPFVGGGAVLFDILNNYSLDKVYISDINQDLIDLYLVIRDDVENFINQLQQIEHNYLSINHTERKNFYLKARHHFNHLKNSNQSSHTLEKSALMLFLNRTCFNGLYRVNKQGNFNVPIGSYKNPVICHTENLKAVSAHLHNVEIICADYKQSADFIDRQTFVYFDPPYRPLTPTANFTSYSKESFTDSNQLELASFVQILDNKGAKILISNSDPKNTNKNDDFFDIAYAKQHIKRIPATRKINRNGSSRGEIQELLISNFNP